MPRTRSQIIYNWKRYGLIHNDYKGLYEEYINTTHCNHCNVEFTKTNYRCMDHDHQTGLFRNVVCKACNTCDKYIKYPTGYTEEDLKRKQQEYRDNHKEQSKEYNKLYKQRNKEKLREVNRLWEQKKITCSCGLVVSNGHKPAHLKTLKHAKRMEQLQ